MQNSRDAPLSRRDRAWVGGLLGLLLVWVFLLGMVFAQLRQPGGLLGGPYFYAVPPGYHLVPNRPGVAGRTP